ncbi:unnamed protein product [Gordionus sp. m RMFG-2023]
MPTPLQDYIINRTKCLMASNSKDSEIARILKTEVQNMNEPYWHCVVGKKFSSYISYEAGCFLWFKIDNKIFLIFKSLYFPKELPH